jgi:hypothetical protein
MSSSVPTEMTVRNFLLKALEQRKVKVSTERSYTTPIGRLVPDMLLRNGAEYVVETKLGAETKLLDAIVRLYDYSKYTEAKGAFAVLFPEELRRPWTEEMLEKIAADPKLRYVATAIFKDFRASTRYEGNLSELADWIASQVLKPLAVEVDTGFAVKVLTEAVDSITLCVRSLQSKDLEEIFGGRTVFENILQYEEGHYPLDEMRQAATYLLVNQIIFYHVLSTANPQFEAIDEGKIGKPVDLLKFFEAVLERDYASVFGFDVASKLPQTATDTIKRVIVAVKALAPEKIGHDVLGKVFHDLIPFNIRKAVAAFYTNNEAAEMLAGLTIDKPDATAIDLACGSGTLLVSAYRRKRELLHCGKNGISLEDHRRFLEHDLTGVDIMPFAAHLAVMHLSLQALLHETEKVRVAVWDSTQLKPNMNIPAIYSELKAAYRKPTLDMFKDKFVIPKDAHIKKGAVTLEGVGGQEIPLEKVDLVIMNPPFTRQERLPKEYKESLARRFNDYQKYAHGQLGLYGYFVFLADKFVKEDGKIAFVLPATVLRVQSARGVRKLLTERYAIEHIITAWERAAFSEAAQFREILLIGRKLPNNKKSQPRTKGLSDCTVTLLKSLPKTIEQAKEFSMKMEDIRNSTERAYEDSSMSIYKISQKNLSKLSDNLFTLISVHEASLIGCWSHALAKADDKFVAFQHYLKEAHADVKRGIETTQRGRVQPLTILADEDKAIKKSDVWVVKKVLGNSLIVKHRYLNKEFAITANSLSRALRRVSGIRRIDVTNSLDYVVSKKFNGLSEFLKMATGNSDTSFIEKWRKYVEERLGNFATVRRMDISASGSCVLAFYSKTPEAPSGLSWSYRIPLDDDAKIMTMWFNCSLNILQTLINRKETRGAFLQLDEYTLEDFQILSPKKLSQEERQTLTETFDKIKDKDLESIMTQLKKKSKVRVEIDMAILKVIGFAENESKDILNGLYPALAEEIEKLKTMMEG